ncbi:MAG TPA: pentapeptide repeat-containing protein, partial [Acidobacteriaceae bacterium]|nr:pentapeptide repeat-containing protein [Acidobacteriaceae bacterium]
DFALFRMAHLERCVFEKCNLIEADFYGADLTGAIFRGCDLSRADISHATLTGADLRDCRLDGMRGKPDAMDGLIISPDQAALLITLFGVRVQW